MSALHQLPSFARLGGSKTRPYTDVARAKKKPRSCERGSGGQECPPYTVLLKADG